ncbi:MAG: hypothetical protein ACUVQZ_08715 [Candidatus Caldatribacteriaceae bacterium]
MALKAGISWHLGPEKLDEAYITFTSDAKDRATRPDREWVDNSGEYLPYRTVLDSFLNQVGGKDYPSVKLSLYLKDSHSEDLLQMCDLLLGATKMALVAGSQSKVKTELWRMVQHCCKDLKQPARNQRYGLYRKFNL